MIQAAPKAARSAALEEAPAAAGMAQPLLSVHLSAGYRGKPAVLRNTSFNIAPGEILGLAGQSGAGKSTVALAILKLLAIKGGRAEGEIHFQPTDGPRRELLSLSEGDMRRLRGRHISLVPQSPISSLNPALTIGAQFREAWSAHQTISFREWKPRLFDILAGVSLPAEDDFLRRYPRELSVGIAQRVLIAMAILHQPALILADEPTSALDLIAQSEILGLFARLNDELGAAVLYISHDLLSIATICHRVAILHQGAIIETGPTEQIFGNPRHSYTQQLIAALPKLGPFS